MCTSKYKHYLFKYKRTYTVNYVGVISIHVYGIPIVDTHTYSRYAYI